MKANEAPEKIYIDANEGWHRTYTAFAEKAKGNDIEYTRTDAFIEKAARYLNYKLFDRVEVVTFGTVIESITSKKEFIDDFRKYMKGE